MRASKDNDQTRLHLLEDVAPQWFATWNSPCVDLTAEDVGPLVIEEERMCIKSHSSSRVTVIEPCRPRRYSV